MDRRTEQNLIQGNILCTLICFAVPVPLALFAGHAWRCRFDYRPAICRNRRAIQGGYRKPDAQHGHNGYYWIDNGLTVFGEEVIGSAEREEAGQSVGCGIITFAVVSILVTDAVVPFTHQLAV